MEKTVEIFLAVARLLFLFLVGGAIKGEVRIKLENRRDEVEWNYSGETGPDCWHKLSEAFKLAKDGKEQSPINIISEDVIREECDIKNMKICYTPGDFFVENNSHTILLVPKSLENYVEIEGVRYNLTQLHFHLPSEHLIDGRGTDMELHLVHKGENGGFAVVGIFIVEGESNLILDETFKRMPKKYNSTSKSKPLIQNMDLRELIPEGDFLYYYNGSFTTPPCMEEVKWVIFKDEIKLSSEQITAFRGLFDMNARPVQNLNGRKVYCCYIR